MTQLDNQPTAGDPGVGLGALHSDPLRKRPIAPPSLGDGLSVAHGDARTVDPSLILGVAPNRGLEPSWLRTRLGEPSNQPVRHGCTVCVSVRLCHGVVLDTTHCVAELGEFLLGGRRSQCAIDARRNESHALCESAWKITARMRKGCTAEVAGEQRVRLRTKTVDARGVEIADEDRSRTDGWEIDAFFPTPVVLGKHLYITTMLGTVYVVDIAAEHLDQRALVAVNDLGPLGDCWSLSGPSCADGVLYHRNARELVAIGRGDQVRK